MNSPLENRKVRLRGLTLAGVREGGQGDVVAAISIAPAGTVAIGRGFLQSLRLEP
jgi:hypothetical protein